MIALCHDDTSISDSPEVRFSIARKIITRASDYGIAAHDVIVDRLVLPDGVPGSIGAQVFPLIRRLGQGLKVNTTCGATLRFSALRSGLA